MIGLLAHLLALITVLGGAANNSVVRNGDIIFHTSRSEQSAAIQKATGSRYSHMGVILFRRDQPYVLEAVATVRYTPLNRWIAREVGGHYVIKRLKGSDAVLTREGVSRLRAVADQLQGRAYDPTFEWSDERIYCSELVWKVYDRAIGVKVGELRRLKDFDLSDPAVRKKMRERYGSNVPLNEAVISPRDVFGSSLLFTIDER